MSHGHLGKAFRHDRRTPARYARVSTADQDEALQIAALEKAGVDALYVNHGVSGTATSRPRFDAMLANLRPGDSVVVYSLSRLSRGMKHLVELGERFEADGIGLVSLTESIDTSTAMGRFVYTMLAALAAMEGACWRSGPAPVWPPRVRRAGSAVGLRS